MNAFDAYKKYVAIKLHFQTDYDYFKFSGKVKASKESFDNRRDRRIFERLAKLYDSDQYELLLVANLIENADVWIGDIATEAGRQKYLNMKKKLQSLQYTFKQDMSRIKDDIDGGVVPDFDSIFKLVLEDACWPHVVSLMVQHDISLESFIVMNKILNFMPRTSKHITDDLVWPEIAKLISNYSPFVRVDLKPFRAIMKSTFLDSEQKNLDV
jgi:hypothetical protein